MYGIGKARRITAKGYVRRVKFDLSKATHTPNQSQEEAHEIISGCGWFVN
jgi:hypothetical protein